MPRVVQSITKNIADPTKVVRKSCGATVDGGLTFEPDPAKRPATARLDDAVRKKHVNASSRRLCGFIVLARRLRGAVNASIPRFFDLLFLLRLTLQASATYNHQNNFLSWVRR